FVFSLIRLLFFICISLSSWLRNRFFSSSRCEPALISVFERRKLSRLTSAATIFGHAAGFGELVRERESFRKTGKIIFAEHRDGGLLRLFPARQSLFEDAPPTRRQRKQAPAGIFAAANGHQPAALQQAEVPGEGGPFEPQMVCQRHERHRLAQANAHQDSELRRLDPGPGKVAGIETPKRARRAARPL